MEKGRDATENDFTVRSSISEKPGEIPVNASVEVGRNSQGFFGEERLSKIQQSVDILLKSDINYEFRTTVIRDFHQPTDIIQMAKQIRGAKHYAVQEFIPQKTLERSFSSKSPFAKSTLESLIPEVQKYVQEFEIRQ